MCNETTSPVFTELVISSRHPFRDRFTVMPAASLKADPLTVLESRMGKRWWRRSSTCASQGEHFRRNTHRLQAGGKRKGRSTPSCPLRKRPAASIVSRLLKRGHRTQGGTIVGAAGRSGVLNGDLGGSGGRLTPACSASCLSRTTRAPMTSHC